ncbi:protein of unknown function [Actinopolyspora xinjiangensis]|uniref:DUF1707 domain-containing protein n=2 Tax=Actinopolyspora xinjiangensis TaxID=405564 RepID=A0A1H0UTJ6_9ACTN|nr:protein of unknown function [Actinopolyspora xinjiangensis]
MLCAMPSESPDFRASDADREKIATLLRQAQREGRLTLDEFDERVAGAYRARTYGELTPLVDDLPDETGGTSATGPPRSPDSRTGRAALGIMSYAERIGPWRVPPRFTTFAFWGGGKIDLRDAFLDAAEVEIHCYAVMGGIEVVVSPGTRVEDRCTAIMGGVERDVRGAASHGESKVVITGLAFWGGVYIHSQEPDGKH